METNWHIHGGLSEREPVVHNILQFSTCLQSCLLWYCCYYKLCKGDNIQWWYISITAKPIDLLAKYISAEEEVDAVEMHEPYTYLNGLTIKDLEDLIEDIKVMSLFMATNKISQ